MNRHYEITKAVERLSLPPGLTIRIWEAADFPAIQLLSSSEGWSTPTERAQASLLSWQRSWPALVAVHQTRIVGFLRAVSDGFVTTYVAEVLVAPEWRKQGIGQALLSGCQRLCPGTRLDLLATIESRDFYSRCGFRAFAGFRRSWEECEDRPI